MKRLVHVLACFGSAALSAGCLPHVLLANSPDLAAPLAQRQAYYRRVRPINANITVSYGAMRFGTTRVENLTHITLADQTQIQLAEDLLPAVFSNSVTGQAVKDERSSRGSAQLIAGTSLVVGAIGVIGAIVTGLNPSSSSRMVGPPFIAFVCLGVGGFGTATIGGVYFHMDAVAHRRRALLSFDESLRQRLNLSPANAHPQEPTESPENTMTIETTAN